MIVNQSCHSDDEVATKYAQAQPLGRIGTMQEMSDTIEFLISDKNSFMIGSNVLSDGGNAIM